MNAMVNKASQDRDLAAVLMTAGFIVEGLMAYNSISDVADQHGEGCLGLITKVTGYAPHIERLWQIGHAYMHAHDKSSGDIWPYDFVSAFGSWYALATITNKEVPHEKQVHEHLLCSAFDYFTKDNDFTEEQQAELDQQLKQATQEATCHMN